MTTINDGGPAFPNPALANESFSPHCDLTGMTLRDWFAGKALCGLITDYGAPYPAFSVFANNAYAIADAMIAARTGAS